MTAVPTRPAPRLGGRPSAGPRAHAEVVDPRVPRWWLPVALAAVVAVLAFAIWGLVDSIETGTSRPDLPRLELPSVSGSGALDAENRLERLGFVVNLRYVPNELTPRDQVFGQSPLAGAKVEQGGVVDVLVSDGPAGVTLPNVIGEGLGTAQSLLAENGLTVTRSDDYDDAVAVGVVIRTTPDPGQRIAINGNVQVVISKGPAPRSVPQLVGQTEDQALVELGRAGLGIGSITHKRADGTPDGQIISASIDAGASVPANTPVDLVVAGTQGDILVPAVVGLRSASAQSALKADGLPSTVVPIAVSAESQQADRVIAQSVAPQSKVPSGTSVQISVGVAAPPTTLAPPTTPAPPTTSPPTTAKPGPTTKPPATTAKPK